MSTAVVETPSPNVAPSSAQLDWHIVLETLADGQVAAWIAEWPDCRVTAAGREDAIALVKQALDEKSEMAAVLAQSIELIPLEHPAMKFVGMMKDDSSFCAWAEEFWAEKQRSHDDDEILTVEECLNVW